MISYLIVAVNPETGAISATGVSIFATNLEHARSILNQEYEYEVENCGWKIFS
jgi:hypothetical protein